MLSALSTDQRAAVAAAFSLSADERRRRVLQRVLARRVPASLLDQLTALDRPGRAQFTAAVSAQHRRDLPSGAAHIHPSWLIDAPAPALLSADAAGARDTASRYARWLARAVGAELVAMPGGALPAYAALTIRDVPRLDGDQLGRALTEFALRQLAWALHAAQPALPPSQLATAASSLELAHGDRLTEHLLALRDRTPPAAWGTQRAALTRLRGLSLGHPHALAQLAARALAPQVARAGGELARQIAQRRPRAEGEVILRELRGPFRAVDLKSAPDWPAFHESIEAG